MIARALLDRTQYLCASDHFRQVVRDHCPYLQERLAPSQPDIHIHPNDQMLLHSLQHHGDAHAAFSQYYNVALQQYSAVQQILHSLFPGVVEKIRFLDFACGYGRLLRLLSVSLPAENIWASEIQQDALRYVCDSFAVQGIKSHADPAAFQPEQRFHFIWVASLFSHLPGDLFRDWVRRLLDCLEPNGVLCFSVHDACLVPPEHRMPDEGILFFPVSENQDLTTDIYGTTYVTEDYVAGVIERVTGTADNYARIPRGLAHEQDIYVVPGTSGRPLAAIEGFRRGPWGWVDERVLAENGELYLRGWAASVDDGPLDTVEITVGTQKYLCPTGKLREDVGRVFADTRLNSSGWEFRHTSTPGERPLRVQVTARTPQNEKALLYVGELERPPR